MGKKHNRIGEKYYKLTIIGKNNKKDDGHTIWICQCDCGNIHYVSSRHWKEVKSCGCLLKSRNGNFNYKSKLYSTWKSMKSRCMIKSNPSYKNYGAKGIKVCNEWLNFNIFKDWAINNGYDENKTRKEQSLDRIKNNGNYEPNNCRWVNSIVQANNTSRNIFLTYNKTTRTMAQWSRILKINYKSFSSFVLNKRHNKNGNKNKKKILQLDMNDNPIKQFNSITEASKETQISITSISEIAKGRRKPMKDFKWKFI